VKHQYIDAAALLSDVFLLDPSKLRVGVINEIWNHWAQRQQEGKQGLVFLKASGGDMRERRRTVDVKNKNKDGPRYVECDDKGEGSSKDGQAPHPESPAAHSMTVEERMEFLKGLCSEKVYQRYIEALDTKIRVSVCFFF
jgi:hypothetical protein